MSSIFSVVGFSTNDNISSSEGISNFLFKKYGMKLMATGENLYICSK